MDDTTQPDPPPREHFPWWAAACPIAAISLSVALIVIGVRVPQAGQAMTASGALGVVLTVALLPLVVFAGRRGPRRPPEMAALQAAIERMSEQQALSDDARRVLHRKRERDLLRGAIEEDLGAGDWDAAMVLVGELAERFGYRADAEEFRQRVEQAREQTQRKLVEEAIARIDHLIVQRRWDQSIVEAARTARLYPESPAVPGLARRIDSARTAYKEDLERRFLESAQHGRAEEALDLMKELDVYLTGAEAEPYREVARGVIGKARENLGAQFKLAVQDRNWETARGVGERIIREFPNTRMASEVRAMLDTIRARAGGQPVRT
ncbi:MAG: hypothetical protein IT437_10375 [Phycisphaerales bacterium]|nr:hypothetical protein [Phycisphaerales bacterium]